MWTARPRSGRDTRRRVLVIFACGLVSAIVPVSQAQFDTGAGVAFDAGPSPQHVVERTFAPGLHYVGLPLDPGDNMDTAGIYGLFGLNPNSAQIDFWDTDYEDISQAFVPLNKDSLDFVIDGSMVLRVNLSGREPVEGEFKGGAWPESDRYLYPDRINAVNVPLDDDMSVRDLVRDVHDPWVSFRGDGEEHFQTYWGGNAANSPGLMEIEPATVYFIMPSEAQHVSFDGSAWGVLAGT